MDSLLALLPDQSFAIALSTYLRRLPPALGVTLQITVGAALLALVIGLIIGLGRTSSNRLVSNLAAWIVYVGRCIPLPPLQLLVYFMILSLVPIDAVVAGMIAVGLQFSPYMAELFRSGISVVPVGQIEAARALGFTEMQVRRRVVVPVATRVMLPAIGQLIVGMLLNSAYVSQIGARDITGVARNIINSMFTTEIWLVVALTYFLIAFPVSRFLSWLERRLALTW
ncbi:MAG: amino acid ABC transporter permease [Hyphomicrobiaceae bacterium]|nr:amino acid ABC transporter permease [Hyphomicrobiaceae bacterium]